MSNHKNKVLKPKKVRSKFSINIDNYEDFFEEGGLEEVRKWFYEEVLPEINKMYIKYKRI
jgi:hypothetical protein